LGLAGIFERVQGSGHRLAHSARRLVNIERYGTELVVLSIPFVSYVILN
jgi:hypothetical protein